MKKLFLFSFFLVFMVACSHSKKETIKIAFDPQWTNFPLTIQEKSNLNGFIEDLLLNISAMSDVSIEKFEDTYDDLDYGLQTKRFDLTISFKKPYNFNLGKYNFSPIIFHPGMVLVVPKKSTCQTLKDFAGKIIAYPEKSAAVLLLQEYPDIIIKTYDAPFSAINDVVSGAIDGVLIENLVATSFMKNLYVDELKIIGPLQEDEGLRMVTLKSNDHLSSCISAALKKVESKGILVQLKQKWHLN